MPTAGGQARSSLNGRRPWKRNSSTRHVPGPTGLAEQEDGDDAAAINSVVQQLQALKVTGRQNVNLDPDEVRVTENGNPTLEGDYTLWLPAKP